MKENPFKKDIEFTRQQSIVLGILCLLLLISYLYTFFAQPVIESNQITYSLEHIISEKEINLDSTAKSKIEKITSGRRQTKHKIYAKPLPKYVRFDPNKTDSLTWIEMGLSPFTVKVINNYLNKGGQFWDCDGLSKIYSLDSVTYLNILPYCHIPQKKKKYKYSKSRKAQKKDSTKFNKPYVPRSSTKVDIAKADSSELTSLYGIGPTLSGRIVKYRDKLGGFHNIEQLIEVWGLEQDVIDGFSDRLIISPSIKKFSLVANPAKLVEHPYINWPQAKIISNYIKRHGPPKDSSTLRKIHGLPTEMIDKIIPYLNFQNKPNTSSMNN